ncbi:MAG: SDR family oxidoreductase [Verrucomicrobia bacterium]|nr:SDR family oxidoreductase [Verrucomicrobiota bacterium]
MNLTGKRVLITGATGGLGSEACIAFLAAGCEVFALDIKPERGALLEQTTRKSGKLEYLNQNLEDREKTRQSIKALQDRVGAIHILINNAAIYPAKRFEDFDLQEYSEIQRVNVEGAIACTQAVLPGMKKEGAGWIVNIASITFYGGWANLYPYVASKGALVGLTRAWAREFGPFGINVNAISVGAIPTDAEKIHPDPDGYQKYVLEHQSLKRRGQPRDIAHVMMFLSSPEASFITGQVINVDGGWVMH